MEKNQGQAQPLLLVCEDLKKALACALVLEQTCEVYRLALSMGGPAEPFPPERVESMKRFLQNSYGQKQS